MVRICQIHDTEFEYVCPKCLELYLFLTNFSSLGDIRDYQERNAKKLNLTDNKENFNLVGIIKTKIINEVAYSGILFYDISKKEPLDMTFKSTKPSFIKYFPSILFLNLTKTWLNLIKDLKEIPDCHIVNASGQIHPYLFGAACDFGLKVDVSVIGYTKKLLFGEFSKKENVDFNGIYYKDTLIGYAVPKPNSKKFLYLSVGNNISLETALNLFLKIDLNILSLLKGELNNYIKTLKA